MVFCLRGFEKTGARERDYKIQLSLDFASFISFVGSMAAVTLDLAEMNNFSDTLDFADDFDVDDWTPTNDQKASAVSFKKKCSSRSIKNTFKMKSEAFMPLNCQNSNPPGVWLSKEGLKIKIERYQFGKNHRMAGKIDLSAIIGQDTGIKVLIYLSTLS